MLVSIGRRTTTDDFVELLLECHQRIRSFARLAVELGNRTDLPASDLVEGCTRCERYFREGLPLHVEDEEQTLLPRVQGHDQGTDDALRTMHREHLEHGPELERLLAALGAVRLHPTEPGPRAALERVAGSLQQAFEGHLQTEEALVFPAWKRLVPPEEQRRAVGELRARRQGSFTRAAP